nr:FBP domain-containing protein [Arthrobacter sp. HY1533]
MLPMTEKQIRSSFLNASQRERNNLNLPENFEALNWEDLDFVGWRDRKYQTLGYVIAWVDGATRGILFREVEGKTRSRAQCSWCNDVTLPNDVAYFTAKRSGASGRNGNTVATLMCSRFECPANVRRHEPPAYVGFDATAARAERMAGLQAQVRTFMDKMMLGSD